MQFNDCECIAFKKNLFKTYHQFSKISGIELNTTKTEILRRGYEHDEQLLTMKARKYPLNLF